MKPETPYTDLLLDTRRAREAYAGLSRDGFPTDTNHFTCVVDVARALEMAGEPVEAVVLMLRDVILNLSDTVTTLRRRLIEALDIRPVSQTISLADISGVSPDLLGPRPPMRGQGEAPRWIADPPGAADACRPPETTTKPSHLDCSGSGDRSAPEGA